MPTRTVDPARFVEWQDDAAIHAAVAAFAWTRRITGIHLHHTWRPRHADWQGVESIVSMWSYHVNVNRWADIAQHCTIAPDGGVWMGRDWNRTPASASGFNGTDLAGPMMVEMVGDFDLGRDVLDGPQLRATLSLIYAINGRWNLAPDTLRFHRQLHLAGKPEPKTCPGTSLDREAFVSLIEAYSWGRAA